MLAYTHSCLFLARALHNIIQSISAAIKHNYLESKVGLIKYKGLWSQYSVPQAGRAPTAIFQDSFGALGREWATLVGAPALEGLDAKTALFSRNQYLRGALRLISPDGLARPMTDRLVSFALNSGKALASPYYKIEVQ